MIFEYRSAAYVVICEQRSTKNRRIVPSIVELTTGPSGAILYSGLEGKEISVEEFRAIAKKGELRLASGDLKTLESNPVVILRALKAISKKGCHLEESLAGEILVH